MKLPSGRVSSVSIKEHVFYLFIYLKNKFKIKIKNSEIGSSGRVSSVSTKEHVFYLFIYLKK